MSYPINYPTPQNADVQIFNFVTNNVTNSYQTWTKPQGANMVWFTLIGAGGGGGTSNGVSNQPGGGSGAVTNAMIPAFLIPDNLNITIPPGGAGGATGGVFDGVAAGAATISCYLNGYNSVLLTANGGGGGTNATSIGAGGAASASTFFSAAGFFQSIAGQNGAPGTITASTTTFLSGGGVGTINCNYGWGITNINTSGAGFFMMSPIMVGIGGAGNSGAANNICSGGIGCGGGGSANGVSATTGGQGGNGLVIIITW